MKITTAPFDALYELPPAVPSSPSTLAIVTIAAALAVDRVLLEHLRDRVLAHEERAGEVDVEHALPLVAVDEVRGSAARDAGRGDDRVEPAVLGDDGRDHGGNGGFVAHVELRERRPAMSTPATARRRRESVTHACRCRTPRRHEHDLAAQLAHRVTVTR